MPIPVVYRKSSENVVASYDYTDLAEGTGVVQYYGCKSQVSGATVVFTKYNLVNFANPHFGTTAT